MIQEQLVDYLLVNNLLCNEQFGFRSGYSTELAALHLGDNMINEMDNGKTPINICVASLQNSPLVGKFWFAFYCSMLWNT